MRQCRFYVTNGLASKINAQLCNGCRINAATVAAFALPHCRIIKVPPEATFLSH